MSKSYGWVHSAIPPFADECLQRSVEPKDMEVDSSGGIVATIASSIGASENSLRLLVSLLLGKLLLIDLQVINIWSKFD